MQLEPTRRSALGREIRLELTRRDLPAAALSRGTGIPASRLSRRINGGKFLVEELAAVSRFFGLPLSELQERAAANV